MKLKDLLEKFIHKHYLRIKIDGAYICDTTSDSAIADLYQNCTVILVEQRYEMRDDLVYLYLEVWLKKE